MRFKIFGMAFVVLLAFSGSVHAEWLDTLFAVEDGHTIGFINSQGKEVVKFEKHRRINDPYFTAAVHPIMDMKSQSVGFIDRRGRWVIPPMFADASKMDVPDLFLVVDHSGRRGLVDGKGDIVAPVQFDEIGPFAGHQTAIFRIGDRYGLIDAAGEIVQDLDPSDMEMLAAEAFDDVSPSRHSSEERPMSLAIGREGAMSRWAMRKKVGR